MRIERASFVLRPWRHGDETSLARLANDPAIAANLRDAFPSPYTSDDAVRWVQAAGAQDPATDLAIDVGGRAVGGVGLRLGEDVFRRSAEIGYWLGAAYRGRGLMTSVVAAMTDDAFSRFDLCRVWAGVFAPNRASARVLEKAGYQLEGRLRRAVVKEGRLLDQLIYASVR